MKKKSLRRKQKQMQISLRFYASFFLKAARSTFPLYNDKTCGCKVINVSVLWQKPQDPPGWSLNLPYGKVDEGNDNGMTLRVTFMCTDLNSVYVKLYL